MATQNGKLLFETEFPVRWGDMDSMGHVNNVMYFRYFEQARLDWYEQLGLDNLTPERIKFVIVDNHAEYLKPVVYPMHVKVQMFGHSPGKSSFISSYELTVSDVIYTRGSAKVVWIDTVAQKSVPLPDDVRALVSAE